MKFKSAMQTTKEMKIGDWYGSTGRTLVYLFLHYLWLLGCPSSESRVEPNVNIHGDVGTEVGRCC